jgi:hypothetical protein
MLDLRIRLTWAQNVKSIDVLGCQLMSCHIQVKKSEIYKPIKAQEVQWNRRQHMNTALLLRSLDPQLFA